MVNKCCIPGCKTGYNKYNKDPTVSIHYFPTDPYLREAWRRAIPRDNFVPSRNSIVCSLHFLPANFKIETSDSNPRRKRKRGSNSLILRRLIQEAVPSVFPTLPYQSAKPVLGDNSDRYDEDAASFPDGKSFSSLEELMERLDLCCFPDVIVAKKGKLLLLHQLSLSENDSPHELLFTIKIFHDLTFQLWIGQVLSSQKSLHHIIRDDVVSRTGQLLNLIAHARKEASELSNKVDAYEQCYQLLHGAREEGRCSDEDKKKVAFLMEQLKLLNQKEKAKKYSPALLAMASLWKKTSPSLYKMILHNGILTMPTSSHLCDEEKDVNKETEAHKKARAVKLIKQEEIVIDEVFTVKMEDNSNGAFYGFDDKL